MVFGEVDSTHKKFCSIVSFVSKLANLVMFLQCVNNGKTGTEISGPFPLYCKSIISWFDWFTWEFCNYFCSVKLNCVQDNSFVLCVR